MDQMDNRMGDDRVDRWHEAKVLRVASADGIKFVIEDA